MRRLALVLIALAWLAPAGARSETDLAFVDAEGRPSSLAAYRGTNVLVNFWATWCGPCKAELPALSRLQAELGGPRFQVLTLSQDRGGTAEARRYLDAHGLDNLPAATDPGMRAGRALKLRGLPTTVLFDTSGREVRRWEGDPDWRSEQVRRELEALLK